LTLSILHANEELEYSLGWSGDDDGNRDNDGDNDGDDHVDDNNDDTRDSEGPKYVVVSVVAGEPPPRVRRSRRRIAIGCYDLLLFHLIFNRGIVK